MFTAPHISRSAHAAAVACALLSIPLEPATANACEPEAGRLAYPSDGDTPPANTRILGTGLSDTLIVEYTDGGPIPGTRTTYGPVATESWVFTPAAALEAGREVSVTLTGVTQRFTPTAALDVAPPAVIQGPTGLSIHRARFVRVSTVAADVCGPPAVGDVWTTIGLDYPGRVEDETAHQEALLHRVRFEGQEVVWVGTQALRASCNGPLGRVQTVTSTAPCVEVSVEDAAGNGARVGSTCLVRDEGGDFAFEERSCVDAEPRDAGPRPPQPDVGSSFDASGTTDAGLSVDAGASEPDAGPPLFGDDVEESCTCVAPGLEPGLGGLGALLFAVLVLGRRRGKLV